VNYKLGESEPKFNWKLIKNGLKLNLDTILLQVMNHHSNEWTPCHWHLWQVVCLFFFFFWDQWNPLNCVFGLFGKLSMRRGASAWFHGVWTCVVKVLEYWMIFLLKIKLNCIWKFCKNWNVPLVLLERSWWGGFSGIFLVRFGFRMWKILIFRWFLPLKFK
jgi:hypothetical protein